METFIKVFFWLAAVSFVLEFIVIVTATYPRKRAEVALWQDMLGVVIRMSMIFWAGTLLFSK